MKIRPVILCGGAGTRLWPKAKKHQAKQFIDFGNWTLLGKTLERVKASIYDAPIISTNAKYLKQVKQHLKNHKIRKFKIVLEPAKRNTAPAILSTALIKDIPNEQPLMFLAADHLIEKVGLLNKAIKKNQKKLTQNNIFIYFLLNLFRNRNTNDVSTAVLIVILVGCTMNSLFYDNILGIFSVLIIGLSMQKNLFIRSSIN